MTTMPAETCATGSQRAYVINAMHLLKDAGYHGTNGARHPSASTRDLAADKLAKATERVVVGDFARPQPDNGSIRHEVTQLFCGAVKVILLESAAALELRRVKCLQDQAGYTFRSGVAAQRQEPYRALAASLAGVLYATALRMSGHPVSAKGHGQETHWCAWRNFHRFVLGMRVRAWSLRIQLTASLNNLNNRRSRTASRVTLDLQAQEALLARGPRQAKGAEPFETDWEAVYADWACDSLKQTLDHLTRKQLARALPAGLSYREYAGKLGMPAGMVMSRHWLVRAIRPRKHGREDPDDTQFQLRAKRNQKDKNTAESRCAQRDAVAVSPGSPQGAHTFARWL